MALGARALENDRRLRYQSASDLSAELLRLKRDSESGHRAAAAKHSTRIPSLAVLPFANLSADKENEYFSDGLAEEIINALTQLPGLRVAARTSSFYFRGKEGDIREIGSKLNVENVLEGSVRKAGNRIRVTAQLISVADGYHLWSERYDRDMTDIFAVQDEISQAIADKLSARLAVSGPLVKRYTQNIEAYDLCLKARHHLYKMTPEGHEKCNRYCEQAIALDPGYTLAYVRMAYSYWKSTFFGFMDPRETIPKIKAAALEAVKLDDTMAEAHAVLGLALGTCDFDWTGAKQEFQRALELDPVSPDIRYFASALASATGRVEEAGGEIKHALELDPLNAHINAVVGMFYLQAGQHDRAIAQCRLAIELDPNLWFAHWQLGLACLYKGLPDEAIATVEKGIKLFGRYSGFLLCLGVCYATTGRSAEARELLEELKTRDRATYVPPSIIGWIHLALGEIDQGLEWFARAVEECDLLAVCTFKSEASLAPLRPHPAFQALLRKMNLAS